MSQWRVQEMKQGGAEVTVSEVSGKCFAIPRPNTHAQWRDWFQRMPSARVTH